MVNNQITTKQKFSKSNGKHYIKDFKRVLICKLCGRIYWPHEIPRRFCQCGGKQFDSVASEAEYYGRSR